MGLYYIAFNRDLVIGYGTSPDETYPQPNEGVETFDTVDELNAALEPLGYVYTE